jgi:NAD(P)-dependent dehydrogenase (short-subunit alcohol dehydrogenase family)
MKGPFLSMIDSDPADITSTVAHLAGESGRNITGTAITVDGGA